MSVFDALKEYDEELQNHITRLRGERDALLKENSELNALLQTTSALLSRRTLCAILELPQPPLLWCGPYDPAIVMPLRNGPSMWPGANHVREGFVVRLADMGVEERVIPRVGRPVMKVVGENYKLRQS